MSQIGRDRKASASNRLRASRTPKAMSRAKATRMAWFQSQNEKNRDAGVSACPRSDVPEQRAHQTVFGRRAHQRPCQGRRPLGWHGFNPKMKKTVTRAFMHVPDRTCPNSERIKPSSGVAHTKGHVKGEGHSDGMVSIPK